jgi:tetratricopeptide (TPR) repeat protein
MSLYDYFTGQQTWSNYVSNRDLGQRFDKALVKSENRLAIRLNQSDSDRAVAQGLGSLEDRLASGMGDLSYDLRDVSGGIDNLRADFHILLGDVVWKLEMQTTVLNDILRTLQAPLDTASKELRARAEDAYKNGWYEEALADFLRSEEKNYQDFMVHRSIGNIYLYHLVDLPKSVEYFSKAAKYARPRDAKQASEAWFFAGISCGLQQNYEAAMKHMEEAVSLNADFSEAHYMRASFAGMLGHNRVASESAERAIQGDARYYERARNDRCFEKVRFTIAQLLARLRANQESEADSQIERLHQTLDRLRKFGVANGVLQNHHTHLREIELVRKQGHYVACRTAYSRASEGLDASLRDGATSLAQKAKDATAEITRVRARLAREVVETESELVKARQEAERASAVTGGTYLVIAAGLGVCGWLYGIAGPVGFVGLIGVPVVAIFGVILLVQSRQAASKVAALQTKAAIEKGRLQPGGDDALNRLDDALKDAEQNQKTIAQLLDEQRSRGHSLKIGAAMNLG